MKVQSEEANIHCWEWDYPMERSTKVILLSGDGPKRIRAILESKYQLCYLRDVNRASGRLEIFENGSNRVYAVLLFEKWTNSNSNIAVLAHEINHLVFTHFKHRGYPIPLVGNNDNDEELFNGQSEWWLYTMLGELNAPAENKQEHLWVFENETHLLEPQ